MPEQTRGEVFIPAPDAAQFGVGAAPNSGGHNGPDDFPQELVLAAQAPFDLGHEAAGRPKSSRACSKTLTACCAWRRSRWRRAAAVRRRRCLALAWRF